MNAIIIEDEKRAQIALQLLLEEYCPQINIVATCDNLPEGIKSIRKHQPKVIFLDIEMPGHSGLELLDFFNEDEINFSIIFTTAYNEYALQAFKLSAVDYLLKPINPSLLESAVNRLEKNLQKQENYQVLKNNLNSDSLTKISIPTGNNLIFIEIAKIDYIKGNGSYSEFFCENKIKYLASKNLKNFENILCEIPTFFRVHKSYIVNLSKVVSYTKTDGGRITLKNGIDLPISSDKVSTVLGLIQLMK